MSGIDVLNKLRRDLRDILMGKPTITGLPGFSVEGHINAVDSWCMRVAEIETKISVLEDLYDPDAKKRREREDRRRKMWIEKHYPEGDSQ